MSSGRLGGSKLEAMCGQRNVPDASLLDGFGVTKWHKAGHSDRKFLHSPPQLKDQAQATNTTMPYGYEAASGYQARRAKPAPQPTPSTSSHHHAAYPAPGPAHVHESIPSTRERRQTAQAPTTQIPADTRPKGARLARPGENPSPAYLHPGSRSYAPAAPASPHSAYMPSPRAPSLSHSTDGEHEDDVDFLPTPEHPSAPLPRADTKSTKSKSKAPAPVSSAHQAAYSAIDDITYQMNTLVLSFQVPHDLEFEPAPLDRHTVPKLTFVAKNRGLLDHNQKLESLQAKLDAVESHGDSNLRQARKDAVTEIEHVLDDLKRMQAMVWSNYVYEQRKKRHA
ncbi:hypothetical protein BDV93DRAFT_606737 [Ceratobasidium sp. AG-I]|nr:hypothetical protein BDV93DRAFT_606737 [Ceratobasidium sp. AG-I]